jgi:hypothetical protein
VKQKYQEDPFAFLVLWSLFFSAIFLIFAFRGLIASTFMHKIDVSNETIQNETNTTDNTIDNSTDNTVNNQTNSPASNSETPTIANDATPVDNSTNTVQNTSE